MKICNVIIISAFLALFQSNVVAEPGPPIPKPSITIEKATTLTWHKFLSEWKKGKDFLHKNYFVQSANYKFFGDVFTSLDGWTADGKNDKKYLESVKDKYAWEIRIAHLMYTDISFLYKVGNNGEVKLLNATQ